MQRYNLNYKGGTYTEGQCYRLQPIFRQQVVPGQTVNIDAQVSLKTAVLTKNVTTPCMMSVWFFYVPHRLVWDGWTDYISQAADRTAVPNTFTTADAFFDKALAAGSAGVQPFYRRAYKLVYNEYFGTNPPAGSTSTGNQWFDDITDDNNVGLYELRNPEQFGSRLVETLETEDPEFPVVASSIPLNAFYKNMMIARSKQRSQMSGDKYVDTLARMGVDASWMISERPEFLGTKSKMVGPQLTAGTQNTELGHEAARFAGKLECNIKSKHFAEHGYIVGVCGVRPIVIAPTSSSADALCDREDAQGFYTADNIQTRDTYFGIGLGVSGQDKYTQRFGYLRNGQWLTGTYNPASWVNTQNLTDTSDLVYPDPANIEFSEELGGVDQYAATTSVSLTGKTPVPLRVA